MYAQVAQESIITWAEAVGIADLTPDISRLLSSDVTYRLRQVLHTASQNLHACKRHRLSPDDFNRALRWMDVPPVLGHSGVVEGVDWLAIPEVGVHVASDPPLNLASTALPGDIYHQPGNPCVKGEWTYISNHVTVKGEGGGDGSLTPLPLPQHLTKYYTDLISAIFGHSNTVFQHLESDLRINPSVGPLVGAVVNGCVRGAQVARQNPCILRRVLLTVRAMLANPHMHVGHAKYVRDIMSLIVFCVVTERKQSHDTHPIRSLATNTMLKVLGCWSEGRVAWDVAVSSLGAVIASTSRPWSQHAGALTALLALGPPAQVSLLPSFSSYYSRLEAALPPSNSLTIASKDAIDAKAAQGVLMSILVKIAASYVRKLPNHTELCIQRKVKLKKKDEDWVTNSDGDNTHEDGVDGAGSAAAGPRQQPSLKTEKETSTTSEVCGSPSFDAPKLDEEDKESVFERLREVYAMGESWFGAAFVLQVPGVYLCLHKSQMPSFMESHIYKELQTTGEALLKDMLTREQNGGGTNKGGASGSGHAEPQSKRRKTDDLGGSSGPAPPSYDLGSDMDFSNMDFETLIGGGTPLRSCKKLPEDVFSYYKRILPRARRVVPLNIQGCCVWEGARLKRPKCSLPEVKVHAHRALLVQHYKSKQFVGKMPHCRFTRPLQPKIKPGYSLHNIIL